MKKNLFFLSLFFLSLLQGVSATPSFSHPVLGKAYEQVNLRIEQKASKMILDENSKKNVEERKVRLGEILVSIDTAFKKRDTAKLKEQAKLFRDGYRETIIFIQNLKNLTVPPNLEKIQDVPGGMEILGESTDITYYSDIFEGRKTSNGNLFSQEYFSAAVCEIPFNTLLQIGKGNTSVIVKTNDRPNCSRYPNVTDLSKTAFETIGKISSGRLQGTRNTLGVVSKNYTKEVLRTGVFSNLGITLDSNIPNTYLKNETFHITGQELLGNEYTILYLTSPSGKSVTLGAKKLPNGQFEYSYPLEETGVYQIVLASGLGFNTSTFLEITVLEDSLFSAKKLISSVKTPEKLEKLEIERVELPDLTSTYFFRFSPKNLHTLTIKSDTETFVYRGFGVIAIRGDALKSLDINKPVSVEVSSQESSTSFSHDTYTLPVTIFNRTMTLASGYKEEKNENITVMEENGNLIIRGIVREGKNVKSDILLILPDGSVEKYTFDAASIDTDKYMKRGKVFEKTLSLKQTGLYLVEVNYDNGFAAYNGPLVYGDVLPVYPNDYDGTQKEISATDDSVVALESLKFVNALRAKSGKSALALDDTLNSLATIKSKDMALHNNLSHTDSNGNKINGTAKHNNIMIAGVIGENIAGGNISFKVLLIGLANSGGHRANMLDDWKNIGIGYVVKDGQVYYTQVFGE
ncbi:MAG: CAP domain-containing protein [Candidatus Gracilibacteria bacterium]|nr:CAP domain-containing protein [Candidatus Gracilibacteria bacterium]